MARYKAVRPVLAGSWAFLPVPGPPGSTFQHYIRTAICVAVSDCPACGSKIRELCTSHGQPILSVHADRRYMARGLIRRLKKTTEAIAGISVGIREKVKQPSQARRKRPPKRDSLAELAARSRAAERRTKRQSKARTGI